MDDVLVAMKSPLVVKTEMDEPYRHRDANSFSSNELNEEN